MIAVLLVAAAAVAGCGSDDDSTTTSTPATTSTTPATTTEAQECDEVTTSLGPVTVLSASIDCDEVTALAEDVLSRDDCVEESPGGVNDCASGEFECSTTIENDPQRAFVVTCTRGGDSAEFSYALGAPGEGNAGDEAQSQPQELTLFSTPSGNIGCAMDVGYVRCDIRERSWEPPPEPADCELDYGQGIELGEDGKASFICAGDTTLGAEEVLDYGETSRVGAFRCVSAAAGITCQADSGHGFFLSKQAYELY